MIETNLDPGRIGGWMQVHSGGKFFPLDPRPEEIHIDDIANGLALICRYGGQGHVDKFYSVAEHSLLMAEYILDPSHDIKNCLNLKSLALVALMHDASEAYAGDLVKAIKTGVGENYRLLELNLQQAIMRKYNLFWDSITWASRVKELDKRIVVNEKAVLFGSAQEWPSDVLTPLEDVKLKCYDPETAKKLWLRLFFKLKGGHIYV